MSFIYKIIPNFLTKSECQQILEFSLENLKLGPAEIISINADRVDKNNRKSNITFFPYYKKSQTPLGLESIFLYVHLNLPPWSK